MMMKTNYNYFMKADGKFDLFYRISAQWEIDLSGINSYS